ncbi:MAG: PTS fructose transporter subunit IIB [Candidatus Aminicenantes bacterium]|nr:PTS fructose transporter subunit IIB [Candidatus Aminicenantes bacterium]
MKIVAVTACPTGIAHTYMAAERLQEAARQLGHSIQVETQGAMGIENELRADTIADADVAVFAADIAVQKRERFAGKKIVEVGVQEAIKRPEGVFAHLEK